MSFDDHQSDTGSSLEVPVVGSETNEAGPLGWLPRLSPHQARLESRLARLGTANGVGPALGWLAESLGVGVSVGPPEVLWRPSALRRVGMVAQFTWPRLSTRFAVGLETPVAHTIVDRLLGFDRLPAEARLPLSPVEWGILTFATAETLRRLGTESECPFGLWDPTLDRVGPDPFDIVGLGRIVTIRWPVTIGTVEGSIRLWTTESLMVARWLKTRPPRPARPRSLRQGSASYSGTWKAEAGTIALPRGLKTLRAGGVLPLIDSRLRGTPLSPSGPVELTLRLTGTDGRFVMDAEPVPNSGAARLTVTTAARQIPTPREAIPMPPSQNEPSPTAATDVPVTLVVELGRVNLTLGRLADLKPGDVVELGRHSREPIELTTAGRLVARGELVLIDTELGVRVTHLFL